MSSEADRTLLEAHRAMQAVAAETATAPALLSEALTVPRLEAMLAGDRVIDEKGLRDHAEAFTSRPLDDAGGGIFDARELAKVVTEQALQEVVEQAVSAEREDPDEPVELMSIRLDIDPKRFRIGAEQSRRSGIDAEASVER